MPRKKKESAYRHINARNLRKPQENKNWMETHAEIHDLTPHEFDLLDEVVQSTAEGRSMHPIYPHVPIDMSQADAIELAPHTHSKIALSRHHKRMVLRGGGAKIDTAIKIAKTVGSAIKTAAKAVLKGTTKAAQFVVKYHKEIDALIKTGLTTAESIQALSRGPESPRRETKQKTDDEKHREQKAADALADSDDEAGASQIPGGASRLYGGASRLQGGALSDRGVMVHRRESTRFMI